MRTLFAFVSAHSLAPAAERHALAAALIFGASYLVFALGHFPKTRIDRPGMAIIGAVGMLAFGVLSPHQAIAAINWATLALLFGMMVLVAALECAGFFDRLMGMVEKHLTPRRLLPGVILTSGVLAAFFVNDVVCVFMVPLVLQATRRMRADPLPALLALATASNIGSVAGMTGNPQNILIGSVSGIGYRSFLLHLAPIAVVGLALDWAVIAWMMGKRLATTIPPARDAEGACASIALPPPEWIAMWKPLLVTAGVFTAFLAGVPPAIAAIVGAALVLMSRRRDPRELYGTVDWGLLIFFAGLFVIVAGAERAGLAPWLLLLAKQAWVQRPAGLVLLTAAMSNVVNNVPTVMILRRLVPHFADPRRAWLLLAMASTLAGNLTITGSVANMIVVERARERVRVSYGDYLKIGVPLTLMTLVLGWLWLR